MGKSLELLGLAAFNIIIAMVLSATFLTKADDTVGNTTVSQLTETNVKKFINEVAEVSGGLREDMDSFSITKYFMRHLSEESQFVSRIAYAMPERPPSERQLEMDKMNFISHILQGMDTMNKRETAVEIEYINIADNGKSATVMTTNYERGIMPVDDGMGEARMIPVTGTSYCEQELILSNENIIQMKNANCDTNIDFSNAY